jgi:hypothetical protein
MSDREDHDYHNMMKLQFKPVDYPLACKLISHVAEKPETNAKFDSFRYDIYVNAITLTADHFHYAVTLYFSSSGPMFSIMKGIMEHYSVYSEYISDIGMSMTEEEREYLQNLYKDSLKRALSKHKNDKS